MLLEKVIEESLNQQINAELYSSYLYLAMAAYLESEQWSGMAAWMVAQSKEEYGHAMKLYGYVNERGGRVKLQAIDAPGEEWDGPEAVFEASYEHEKKVTSMIYDLVRLAKSKEDFATESILRWFVDEQVEEESSVSGIIDKMGKVRDSMNGLFMLDSKLGERAAH